ncbi:sphingosine 1-phosphate receptor 1-like [Xenia sp. Carnegie-2017]|uniref:sphingosine 1-phosphate receptor 1-like n=1 Tax=Xenia sp. Carnegie-2017 TaxID=2897299 RepID=UPI001F041939|nr:sphingosine 1-phosphate receptor 1-like [Xenia sp. Carnegie-2017]
MNTEGNQTLMSCSGVKAPDVLLVMIGFAAAVLNVLLLLVMYNERKRFFRTRVSFLIANLALADCLTGMMLVLVMVLKFAQKDKTLHGFQFLFLCGSIQLSFYTLIFMSVDRLIVAIKPMTWSNILTKRKTIIGIILIWGFAIVGSVVMKYATTRRLLFLLFLEIIVLSFIFIHIVIFLVLRRQRRSLSNSGSSADVSHVMDLSLQACHAHITSIVLTLMLVLIVTYMPYIVFSNIIFARQGSGMSLLVYDSGFRYAQAFSYLNYAANPVVYAWRLRVYRRAFSR